ncbi:SMI1/KNR4 family protein [Streptomyces sp. NBC_00690]|uniref:SMI1/KNR4 family protein n=1 Tax=Streptomyces sp. NBC_00690 TaxID=2975808 RepID=UPI002E282AC8|nr:SMI1/KNR4 family protein [Streptomyces sp. NBC_00690]
MGDPSGLPGILTVMVDGGAFEDCPDLAVGYIREPERIEIRYVTPAPSTKPSADTQQPEEEQEQEELAIPSTNSVTEREIVDAWGRIARWLHDNAPASHAALRSGARQKAIDALEQNLDVPIPPALRALWLLTSGDNGVSGRGCLPGNQALMTLEEVSAVYRFKMDAQANKDILNARRPEHDRFTLWKATWIPVVSLGPDDRSSGLYLDTATGYLGRWSRYREAPDDELDTLVTYLEEVADMLEAPDLAVRDKPGLIGDTLVWGSMLDTQQEEHWQPFTG